MSVTPTQIVQHLKTYLPLFTSAFTETLAITGAVVGAGNILTITSLAHGKSAGQCVVLSGGLTRNELTAATLEADDTVTFTTLYEHDLIVPSLPLDDESIILGGFGSVWDGEHIINDVSNRLNFNVALPAGETLAPVLDGNQYLVYSLPLGAYPIATVPTVDTFTIDLSSSPEQPLGAVDSAEIIAGFRIAAAANFARAQAAYSEQGTDEPYLFVIMTDTDVNKDRHTLNDGVAGLTAQDERLLRLLQSFSTSVFIPTTGDLAGSAAQDLAYGTINTALLSTLFCSAIETDSLVPYVTVPVGHGPGEYNSAYYVHVYDWQLPQVINYSYGFLEQPDVAFRDILQTLNVLNDAEAPMIANIDLDDEPL